MPIILLHSSKTMRPLSGNRDLAGQGPTFIKEADTLVRYLKKLDVDSIKTTMKLSDSKAREVVELYKNYALAGNGEPAIDMFLGDIYSGFQAPKLSGDDRAYANQHLFILSGLYGVLRALDEIKPYRLEMGYIFPDLNLYDFWGDTIANYLPTDQPIINLSAKEYTKAVLPYLKSKDGSHEVQIISPKFLTVHPVTGEPRFVTVHAKIARGAFAHWLIVHRVEDISKLSLFDQLGYKYDPVLSTPEEPVYVAKTFEGLGLSIRKK